MGQRSEKLLHDAVVSPPLALLFVELPSIAKGGRVIRLSMSARAAANLLALLAADKVDGKEFASVIALDPGLAAWCLLRAGDNQLRTAGALGNWLAEAWPTALAPSPKQAATSTSRAAPPRDSGRMAYARKIALALLTAQLAGELAQHAGKPGMVDEAVLAGLVWDEVHAACSAAADGKKESPLSILPDWLAKVVVPSKGKSPRKLPADFARSARELLLAHLHSTGSHGPITTSHPVPDTATPKGFSFNLADWQARQKLLISAYRTPLPGLDRFATAVERLARLACLEVDFERRLELEKIESLKELAYGAGHEINNPLANISARAQTLIKEEFDPERRRKLASIHAQALRAHEMIADMMFFARPPQPVLAEVDLVALIAELLPAIRSLAAAQQTSLAWSTPDAPIIVQADRAQLAVALRALCNNALEALQSGGELRIELEKTGGARGEESATGAASISTPCVKLRVVDNGPGIPPEVRKHLFDPFYSGREAGRGLGLGLCKCWRIAELHGGSIDVASQSGSTRFTLVLPL